MASPGSSFVIIDTDPGIDDITAILLALTSPELEILAFIVSFGNTDIDHSYQNLLKLHRCLSQHLEKHPEDSPRFPNFRSERKPFLVKGESGPLEGDLHSAQYFHGRDGLGGLSERHPEFNIPASELESMTTHPFYEMSDKPGAELALELLEKHPAESITYIAMGPLTTLAKMMRLNSTLVKSKIGRVLCMGGALDVPGNTSPVAEFNFFADPFAVKELLAPSSPGAGFPLDKFILFPLDITTPHILPFPTYKDKVDLLFESAKRPSVLGDKTPLVHFTSSYLERTREVMLEYGKDAMELHDILPVWFAIEHPYPPAQPTAVNAPFESLNQDWHAVRRKFDIERTGELTRGMLVIDRRDALESDTYVYAPGANRAEVQAALERQLFHPHGNEWESTAMPAQVEVEEKATSDPPGRHPGVLCVTRTPGPGVLLDVMLKRIWGVRDP